MENPFKEIYGQILSHQEVILDAALKSALIFFLTAVAWWIFNGVLRRVWKRLESRPFFKENPRLFYLVKRAGHYTILILAGISLLNLVHFSLMERIFYAFMILLLASFANSFAKAFLPVLHKKIALQTQSKVDDVIFELLNRFASVIIFVTGIILVLDVLGVNIVPFIAGAGVAGIAIGFAAKDTLSNLIAGILLIIDRPFEVGDRIEVWTAPKNSATWGDVVDIGLRATKIRTTDNIVIVIPNNEIMKRDIINYTAITDEIRVRIPIGVAYDADIRKAKEIIKDVALELDWVIRDPEPKVVVKSFGDSSVNLEARVWISIPRKRIDTISHVVDRVKEVFDREGIEIPYPKRDIYIKPVRGAGPVRDATIRPGFPKRRLKPAAPLKERKHQVRQEYAPGILSKDRH
ncbi:MAG: mechanosensitive ion channel family protein [Deltaproteobacteria bacterium]|nr:mechanosensitive ion channel family protein [Deltaproteobacteria bacterium]